jgi:hypothetical protein
MEYELNKKIDNLYENFASEEKKKLSNQTEFEISDFFGINELQKIKEDPEYIIEKIRIILKNFVTLDEYVYKLSQNQKWEILVSKDKSSKGKNKKEEKCDINKIEQKKEKEIQKIEEYKDLSDENVKFDDFEEKSKATGSNTSSSKPLSELLSMDSNKLYNYSSQKYINSSSNDWSSLSENKKENETKIMDSYKLKFFKQKLNLEEEENLSGIAYEEYAKKCLKLMLILIIKNYPIFNNPKRVDIKKLTQFYQLNCLANKIKSDNTIDLNEIVNPYFEGDIVLELNNQELEKFFIKYKKNIFLKENFNENINDKSKTLFIEIARDIISQGKEKFIQIKNYIKIIKIMNLLNNSLETEEEEYKNICNEYKCSKNTEKIFGLITDGNYDKLNFVINEIILPLYYSIINEEKNISNKNEDDKCKHDKDDNIENNEKKIKNDIKNKDDIKDNDKNKIKDIIKENIKENIKDNDNNNVNIKNKILKIKDEIIKNHLFDDIINLNGLIYNIYYVFEIFYCLKKNNIKFFIIYIGNILEQKTTKNLLNHLVTNNYTNEKIIELNNSITNKQQELSNIKKIYNNVKKTINQFEKECEYRITFSKKIIQNFFDKININNIFDYKTYIKNNKNNKILINAKLFILCQNEEEISKIDSPLINDLKQFLKFEICPLIMKNKKNLVEIEKNIKINSSYPYFIYSNNANPFLSLILNKPKNLFFIIKDGDKEQFLDEETLKNFLDYGSIIKNKINKFFNEYKSKYSENAKLMKDNLTNKLIHDLKQVFQLNIDLKMSINELEFDIDKNEKEKLINYFEKVLNILNIQKKENKNYSLVENIFQNNLNELIQNILSRHLYDLIFYKIQNIIINGINNDLMNTLNKHNKD